MASNYGIAVDRNSDGFGLQLAGDFDGTSAYELIYDGLVKSLQDRHPGERRGPKRLEITGFRLSPE